MEKEIKHNDYLFVYNKKENNPGVEGFLDVHIDHYIMEVYGVKKNLLNNVKSVSRLLDKISSGLNLRVVKNFFYPFEPGVSGILIIAESHLAIHTWPEKHYAHIDLITCSKDTDFSNLNKLLEKTFEPEYYEITKLVY